MQKKIAALMVNGKVVTGLNHGFAFTKLSEEEKDCPTLRSGFFDPTTGCFSDDCQPCARANSLLVIRHAHAHYDHLTPAGRDAALAIGDWLVRSQFRSYPVLCSPKTRCQETSFLLGKSFRVTDALDEVAEDEPLSHVWDRLGRLISECGTAIYVTHQDTARCVAELIHADDPGPVPYAAVLHFQADRLEWQTAGTELCNA